MKAKFKIGDYIIYKTKTMYKLLVVVGIRKTSRKLYDNSGKCLNYYIVKNLFDDDDYCRRDEIGIGSKAEISYMHKISRDEAMVEIL